MHTKLQGHLLAPMPVFLCFLCLSFIFCVTSSASPPSQNQEEPTIERPQKKPPRWWSREELEEKLSQGFIQGKMLERFLAGPMKGQEEIVFAIRIPGRDHWYVSFGNYAAPLREPRERAYKVEDGLIWGYGEGAMLCRMDLRTGKVKVLFDDPSGGIRDPQLHYDGKKILFSYRKGGTHPYHLYEIDTNGQNLTQLTDGPDDDIEPTYCPDGTIVFGSSRCKRFVNCWHTRVASLYRCDADGKNVRMLSSNNDHDNTPWMLPDGQILYMRWEYVDRSQVHYHHLWIMNPDGTQQMVYYGNLHPGIAMLDAKPIPGSDKIVVSFSPGHGRSEHLGKIVVVSPKLGPDNEELAVREVTPGSSWRDPYAYDEHAFIAAENLDRFCVVDSNDGYKVQRIYELPKEFTEYGFAVHEPRPIRSRPRERIIPDRTDLTKATGELMLQNIYVGRKMANVKPGTIKKLLVLRQLPKPVNFSGGMEPLTIGGSFTMAEVLGTIPVEPDGSAYAKVPALQSLFLVALDEQNRSVKRMHSFLTLEPGEQSSCIGCHEERTQAPLVTEQLPLAMTRRPDTIKPIEGVPSILDFPRDVQPILDRLCVECHNSDRTEGRVNLSGDKTPRYTMSYWAMRHHQLVVDARNRPTSNYDPYTFGSGASKLLKYLDGSHYDAKATPHELDVIRLWLDSSATYPGTYAALNSGDSMVYLDQAILHGSCAECHLKDTKDRYGKPIKLWTFGPTHGTPNRGIISNLSQPEKSLLLRAPLAKEAGGLERCGKVIWSDKSASDYKAFLASLQSAKKRLDQDKRFDMPGFRPNKHYIREMQNYGFLPKDLGPTETFDIYEVEKRYFDSWFFDPQTKSTGKPKDEKKELN